ncbi:hypothetical protein BHU72_04150 [Desulfuribacillus stibiiarsenatis]|uniref:AbrB family transcriptional regulator n=1 Tax=Desulfuribacillus stibiiarsenatis TaxID=1390249 RepID=A0A1E5L5L2_9FIRM|nr:AbrB family transcriptional regulator [Desulfuribacillus stibiiarsenatis]OEH85293.1 hypothetical protein BHU72_04150 [Desulfuribacillus stibiiarsenatis]
MRVLRQVITTISIASLGGVTFYYLSLPLTWILGPLSFLLITKAVFHYAFEWPSILRNFSFIILGYYLGASFRASDIETLLYQVPSMLFITFILILLGAMFAYIISKLTNISFDSLLIGSIPGGLSQMVYICTDFKHLDANVIALMHMLRLLLVVFIVPFFTVHFLVTEHHIFPPTLNNLEFTWTALFIYSILIAIATIISIRIKVPTPHLIAPILMTMALVSIDIPAPRLPVSLFVLIQIFLGIHIASSIDPFKIFALKKLAVYSTIASILLIIISLGLGYALTIIYPDISLATGFLSAAPGGVAEMGVTAKAIQANVPFVTGYQLVRVVLITILIPILVKLWYQWQKPIA